MPRQEIPDLPSATPPRQQPVHPFKRQLYERIHAEQLHSCFTQGSVLFLSGDSTICGLAREMVPDITTAVTKTGLGASTYCKAPGQVEETIRQGVKKALAGNLSRCQCGASGDIYI